MALSQCQRLLRPSGPLRMPLRTLFADVAHRGDDGVALRIHYELSGRGAHPVLLLPGALGSTQTDFAPQLALFQEDEDLGVMVYRVHPTGLLLSTSSFETPMMPSLS